MSPANTWHQLLVNILKHYWRHICLTRPRRFVTFYISALGILLLTYLLSAKVSTQQPWYTSRLSLHSKWNSVKCEVIQNSEKIWTCNSSRSSKVHDFGTNRKHICDFLLVRNSNLGHILHRFCDTETYWLKIVYFSYPSLIWRPLCSHHGVVNHEETKSHGATQWWKLHDPNFNRLWLIHPCGRRTDRRMDDSI